MNSLCSLDTGFCCEQCGIYIKRDNVQISYHLDTDTVKIIVSCHGEKKELFIDRLTLYNLYETKRSLKLLTLFPKDDNIKETNILDTILEEKVFKL